MRIVDAAECASQAEAIRMAVFTFDHLIAAQQRGEINHHHAA